MDDKDFTTDPLYIKSLGKDNTAYLFWASGSLMWIIGFIYVNEHSIGFESSTLTRAIALFLVNFLYIYYPRNQQEEMGSMMQDKSLVLLTVRHIILTIHGTAFTAAQFYLPAPVLYTLYFSGPLFIISVDYFAYDMKITKNQLKGVIMAFVGVMCVSNGQLITAWISGNYDFTTKFQHYKTDSLFVKALVALIMMFLTVCWAFGLIITRQVHGTPTSRSNFNFAYVMIFFAAVLYQTNSTTQPYYDNYSLVLKCLLFQGLPLAFGQFLKMHALLLTKKTGTMAMIGFVGLAFSYFLSIFRYGEEVNWLCLSGTILVLIGVAFIVIK